VVGIRIVERGAGYSPKHLPAVALVGGTAGPNARTAILAPATVSNGGVDFVRVMDGGAGYVDPIAVIVAPGNPFDNAVPVWAAAGALKSSTRDMVWFAEAALGHQWVNDVQVDGKLRSALQMAQKGYACETPDQRPCVGLSGLAWAISPTDGGMREIVAKNGGLPGFTTELRLVPSTDLGVIVFANSSQTPLEASDPADAEKSAKPPSTAGLIADNIVYAIARLKLP
jgi:CubicO group peptidase (beta-lactamase class C family)